jgi:hypothetical protein
MFLNDTTGNVEQVGGYDLIVQNVTTFLNDTTGNVEPLPPSMVLPSHGGACMASAYTEYITNLFQTFINGTGMSMFDTDGPYGGAVCTSTNHSHHHGAGDSVYWQTQNQNAFYYKLREEGVYLHVPDDGYFYAGSQDTGEGQRATDQSAKMVRFNCRTDVSVR